MVGSPESELGTMSGEMDDLAWERPICDAALGLIISRYWV